MSDLQELYQELILDHYRRPCNRRKLEQADRTAEGFNPLCGDRITVYAVVEDDVIKDLSFEGSGCAISTASASLMTQKLKGMSLAEAEAVFDRFHAMVTDESRRADDGAELGKLAVFSGVRKYPARVKCATLAWHTVKAALQQHNKMVTTE